MQLTSDALIRLPGPDADPVSALPPGQQRVNELFRRAHLKKLVAGRLVRAQPRGRQQLYSIASEPVADALEILILIAPQGASGR